MDLDYIKDEPDDKVVKYGEDIEIECINGYSYLSASNSSILNRLCIRKGIGDCIKELLISDNGGIRYWVLKRHVKYTKFGRLVLSSPNDINKSLSAEELDALINEDFMPSQEFYRITLDMLKKGSGFRASWPPVDIVDG